VPCDGQSRPVFESKIRPEQLRGRERYRGRKRWRDIFRPRNHSSTKRFINLVVITRQLMGRQLRDHERSGHTRTNIEGIRQFLETEFAIEQLGASLWRVQVAARKS
jgi:hypothetical protein